MGRQISDCCVSQSGAPAGAGCAGWATSIKRRLYPNRSGIVGRFWRSRSRPCAEHLDLESGKLLLVDRLRRLRLRTAHFDRLRDAAPGGFAGLNDVLGVRWRALRLLAFIHQLLLAIRRQEAHINQTYDLPCGMQRREVLRARL